MSDQAELFHDPAMDLKPWQGGPDRDAPAPVRMESGDTERAAAAAVTPKTGTWRRLVLVAILNMPEGATHRDLEELFPEARPQTIRTRCSELVRDGYVAAAGWTRRIDSGLEAKVWVATEKAREWAASRDA